MSTTLPIERNFGLALFAIAAPCVLYWPSLVSMATSWADSYRHGYIIPAVSILLLWRDRGSYAFGRPSGSWWGVGAIAVLVALWVVARGTAVQLVEQLAVAAMASAFALSLFGWQIYRRIWFPLAYLLLAVPVGASVIPYLMEITATVSVAGLRLLDVAALREGMIVILPGGTFEIVEGCSGYSYLNAGLALSVLVAHMMFSVLWKQALYVFVVIAAIILANAARAFIVMLVASASNLRLMAGEDHIFFGWILFLTVMLSMYWAAEKLSDVRPHRIA